MAYQFNPFTGKLDLVGASGGGSGTVTSVALSAPGVLYTVTGSPVTSSGTLTLNLISQTANTFLAAPNGSSGTPSFRAIVPADVPTLNQNTTGTASNITATSNSTLTTLSSLSLPGSQVTGFTQGSVLFAGASGQITQDNTKFFWNDTSDYLGLGLNTPADILHMQVNSASATRHVLLDTYGTSGAGYRTRYAQGVVGTPTAALSGNALGTFGALGYGASQFAASNTGALAIHANENFTNTSNATYMRFLVTPTGSVTAAEAMRINSTGNVLIDTITDNGVDSLQIGSGIAANYMKFTGATSGYVEFIANGTTTSYNLSLPASQGPASSYLLNDGAGNLTWTSGTPPVVTNNIDGGSSATLYTSPQIIVGGTP